MIFVYGFLVIMVQMTLLWIVSIKIKNVSIVDPFWGLGFVIVAVYYYLNVQEHSLRSKIVLTLAIIWGLRLFIYLLWRSWNKEEDYRYQQFRNDYGAQRYWWFSFFQVFLLQGFLLWLISAPLLAAMYFGSTTSLYILDYVAILIWFIGFSFEAGGDYQLAKFKSNPENKGKLLTSGFWKYTRHPNYFGDAIVWWAFGLFSIAAGTYLPILSSILMSWL
ncbi:MAG: DUF1295 domain-containing protein, partial [Flavobacteriaceae bacterium]|nr:DUF1295 domain-containing protein [Flavobacteriaceae bacterium]